MLMCLSFAGCNNTDEAIRDLEQKIELLNEKIEKLESLAKVETTPTDDEKAKDYLGFFCGGKG